MLFSIEARISMLVNHPFSLEVAMSSIQAMKACLGDKIRSFVGRSFHSLKWNSRTFYLIE